MTTQNPLPLSSDAGALLRQASSLRRWLILGVIAINLVVAAVGVENLFDSRERTIEQVRQATGNYGNLLEDNIRNSAQRIDLALQHITDTLERDLVQHRRKDDEIDALLGKHDQRHPEVTAFLLTDAKGDVRWGKGVDRSNPANLADREHFQQHRAEPGRRLIVTEPLFVRVPKTWAVVFSRSFRASDGGFAGMITAIVPVEHFTGLLSGLDLGPHGSAVIRHNNFALVTRYPPVEGSGGATGSKNATPEFRAVFESGVDSTHYFTPKAPDGYARTIAFRRIEQLPMVALVGMAPDDYLHLWGREVRNAGLMYGVFLLLSIAAAWTIHRFWLRHVHDFTARHSSEERLRNFVANQPGVAYALDKDGIFTLSEGQGLALLGLHPGQVVGQSVFDLYRNSPDICAHIRQALAGQTQTFETQVGDLIFDSWVGPLTDLTGQPCGAIGISWEISVRKKAEAELARHRERLEELVKIRTTELVEAKVAAETANIAKSAFLANMSHEIRTPLNAITGMAHLLHRSGLTAEQTDKLGKIENAGSHLLRIINDVLDLSKIEASKLALEDAPVHVEALLNNVASMLGQKAQDKGLHFRIEAAALPHALRGDPTRLQQALLNYAANAVKFTEQGRITLRVTQADETDDTATLRFEVEDTGIGIEPDAIPRLFSAFEQADNSTTRQYGGTGLGLAITQKIAEVMSGTAGVTSTPGQGSTFWFTAVLRKTHETVEESTRDSVQAAEQVIQRYHAGKRILLADDEPVNQEIAQILLEDVGLAVDLAEDGRTAVEKARSGGYAIILMDMQMPVLDGLDATRQIRQMPGHQATPILAMTANAFTEDKDRCFEAGMDDFIAKPVKPEVLYAILLKWFEERRD